MSPVHLASNGHQTTPNLNTSVRCSPQLTTKSPKHQLRPNALRVKHYSIRTDRAYVNWIKCFIYSYNVRHPAEMGAAKIEAFLTYLAANENVAASTWKSCSLNKSRF